MATTETIDDLLAFCMRDGESLVAWCRRVNFPLRTLMRIRAGETKPTAGTVSQLAHAMRFGIKGSREERMQRIRRAI